MPETRSPHSGALLLRAALPLALLILLPGIARAQQKPAAKPGEKPAGAATPSASAKKTFVVKLPPGGQYVITIPESKSPPVQATNGQATLDVPSGVPKFTLEVADEQSGYAARKEMQAASAPAEVTLTSADMTLVHLVRLKVTGAKDKPVANAVVVLEDGAGKVHQASLTPARAGEIEFEDVAEGQGKVTVAPLGASSTEKTVTIGLQKGQSSQDLTVGLPEVTAVVDAAAPAAGTTAGTGSTGAAAPAAGTPPPTGAAAPAAPPATSAPPVERPSEGGGAAAFFNTVLSFLLLAAIIFGVYTYGKKQGWTVEGAMAKLGVQTQTVSGGPSGGPAPAASPAPPPPVVADPNRCQFCGEMKDPATGGCACTVSPGAAGGFAAAQPFGSPGGGAMGSGPRLIGAAGTYMGEIFPLAGESVVGRDPSSSIPLDRDTTVSRRHARLVPDSGGYRIIDEGSSNGVYVNGARVTDSVLRPGDEVGIGGTRFRFEV